MKSIFISLVIGLGLVGGAFWLLSDKTSSNDERKVVVDNVNNVQVVDGIQIINIKAKGGYSPQNSIAKAGLPTVIRFNTSGTFDCSSAVRIPSLDINTNLPPSGSTDIDIGESKLGALQVTCGMGMYSFVVNFEA